MKTFAGRVAVVTGGASGIGRAMADRFSREGMKVVLADVEQVALDQAEREMREAGCAAIIGVRTDVADASQVKALAERTLEAFGAVHIVCNNAGVGSRFGPLWEQSEADWAWVLNVNLQGVLNGIRTFVPILLAQQDEGHVINTASLAGLMASPFMGPYNVSKSAVVAITETLWYELKVIQSKIGASVLCPAWVKTRIADAARNRPSDLAEGPRGPISAMLDQRFGGYMERMLNERGVPPEEIAGKVFDAVRDERLYILTHPEFSPLVPKRAQEIVEQRNPDIVAVLQAFQQSVN